MPYKITREWATGDREAFTVTENHWNIGDHITTVGSAFTVIAIEETEPPRCCHMCGEPGRAKYTFRSDFAYARRGLTRIANLIKENQYVDAAEVANEISAVMATMCEDLEHMQHLADRR